MFQAPKHAAMKETEPYLKEFERLERQAKQPSWVFPLRKAGIARFAEIGFPTLKDEDWRFTNVAPIAKLPFEPVFEVRRDGLSADAIARFTFGQASQTRLVFVNGHYAAELSAAGQQPQGVVLTSLAAALAGDSPLIEKHLARHARGDESAFTALNAAFFQDGAFIRVPEGTIVEAQIHLLFVATAGEAGATSHPRSLILAEKDSQVTVLESYVSAVEGTYFTNAVTEIVLGEGAVMEHCKFQDESQSAFHVAALHSHLGRRCNLISHSIAAGARLSRNNIRASLAGEGVECVLNGLYLTRDDQLADHHMIVEHAQPHCNSHEYYNGILDGRSNGVFHR